ncbi:MAG: gliding motility-associated C-terminal domain-containing protein [Prevotellaceae bacterium]|jgi:gliding motility-associated-like protein/uncharacterized repeat protein (TIGR01451 family)|nr:gliding motility-associated C-terminal domain-containing protein [Prevotellaceae bacterium]
MKHSFSKVYKHKRPLSAFALLLFAQPAFAGQVDFVVSAGKTEIRQGEELTYSVSVYNRDAAALENILVADSMPKGVTLVSCSATGGYELSNRSMLVKIPCLPAGEEHSFDVTVRVDRRGSVVKAVQLHENGALLRTVSHAVNVLSNNVLTSSVGMFTPNGDGVDDYFEIPGLLSYPNNKLLMFNRYSDEVYQKRSYANDWDGGNLPDGGYYYLLTIYLDKDVVQKYSGFVSIKR